MGGKGGNFVETMLRLAAQGKPVRVVDDQVLTPSYTADVAAATAELLHSEARGVFHLVNAGSCSWCEFARMIFQLANVKVAVEGIRSTDWPAAAARPSYSVLASSRTAPLRPWREALTAYLAERHQRTSTP